jgi:RNA polymerase sigma-70 factor (ECF subfamily)
VSFDQTVGGDSDTTLAEIFQADIETPQDIAVTNEFQERVSAAMELLNVKHREVLVLRNVKSLSYEEIANQLGISIGTVKSRIARARESLRDRLGNELL